MVKPVTTEVLSRLEECIAFAEDRGGYPDFDSSPLIKAVEPFEVPPQHANPTLESSDRETVKQLIFRIFRIPRCKVFMPSLFTLLRYYVITSGQEGLKVFDETTPSQIVLLDFATDSLASDTAAIRRNAALALSGVTRVGRSGSVFSNIVDHMVVTSAQAESWEAVEGVLLTIASIFQECDTLSDTQFRTLFGIVTSHCSAPTLTGDDRASVRDHAYQAVSAAVSHQPVKCKAGSLPSEIRKVAQAGLRDDIPSVREAAASLHVSVLGDADVVSTEAVDKLLLEMVSGLQALNATARVTHGTCLVLKNLSREGAYLRQASPANLTKVLDELCKAVKSNPISADDILVTCVAAEAIVQFFDAQLHIVFTSALDGAEDASDVYTKKVHPQVISLLESTGAERHVLFAAGCRCIAELIRRQKAFMKPHLGSLFPPIFVQLFDSNNKIAEEVQLNWDAIITAYGDPHSFYSVFAPALLKGLNGMLANATDVSDEAGKGKLASAFKAVQFLCRHPGAVAHVVNANTASSLFDALVGCTSSASESTDIRIAAGSLDALNALLSIPNSPLCSSQVLQKRISISLVPTLLPLLRSSSDNVVVSALECVESVLRHWVHAFTTPEGLYILVPETMVLTHSSNDRIRYRARPVLIAMVGDLRVSLTQEPALVDVVAGGLTAKIGLDESQNPSRESRLSVSRALLGIAAVLVPGDSDMPAEAVAWPTFTSRQVHTLLNLTAHGILGPVNSQDEEVQGNCITFLSVFTMVPQCRSSLGNDENRSLVNALVWYFLHGLTMRYDTFDVSRLRPFSEGDPDGDPAESLALDTASLEKMDLPGQPNDATLQKFLVVAHTLSLLASSADVDVQKSLCESMVAIFGHLLPKNSVVFGQAFLHILPHFLASGMETDALDEVREFTGDLETAMSIPVWDADVAPEDLVAKFSTMMQGNTWETTKISHQLALISSALTALEGDDVPRSQIYSDTLSLAHRTSEEGVAGRRVKSMLIELLVRAGSTADPDTSADGTELLFTPPSTPKFFFDIASLLCKQKSSSPFDIVEQTGFMLDEYSTSHVTGLIYQAIDAFWSEMSPEQRFMTVAVIQGQLLEATPDEVQQRLQLLAHCLQEPYFSSEMRLMLFGLLFSQLASPKDKPQVFLAVCEAVAATLSSMEEEPFNRDLFMNLLETLQEPNVLKNSQGGASAWLSVACTTLARSLTITLDGNSAPTDSSIREYLKGIRKLLQTRGLSSASKDRICGNLAVLADSAIPENESGHLHARRRLCLPAVTTTV